MSTVVRPAVAKDVEAICQLLHGKMNSRIPLDRWRNLMNYPWLENKPDFGRVVESRGEILGYCGMVYVDRMLGDAGTVQRAERMVSMSSWYLDKSLRGQGLGKEMLMSSTENSSLTYATLTNSRKPLAIVESCGFRVLENERCIWRKSRSEGSAVSLVRERAEIRRKLTPVELKLVDDLADQPLLPVVLLAEGQQALLFFSVKKKAQDITWYDLMYSSNLGLFTEYAQSLADLMLSDSPAVLAADSRFVPDVNAGVERQALPVPRFFKSERVASHEVDHLYSELQLLDLKLD